MLFQQCDMMRGELWLCMTDELAVMDVTVLSKPFSGGEIAY